MEEIWKTIEDYENYMVSNLGRVYSKRSKRYLKSSLTSSGKGYQHISLCKDGKAKSFMIHRLVAEAFIPNPDNLPCVNHKDENKMNNCIDNLEWCTAQYNNTYGTIIQRTKKKISKVVEQYTLDDEFVAEYQSTKEAGKQFGKNACMLIQKVCSGYKTFHTAYGFKWRYKD